MKQSDRHRYELHARSRSFGSRVEEACRELARASNLGRLVVSMSWGKDSTVLGHLALETMEHPVHMMHLASAYELPGWEPVSKYFSDRAMVHVLESMKSLGDVIDWLKATGLPHERTKSAQQNVVKSIKKDRAAEWAADNGFSVTALGMRAQESSARRSCMKCNGLTYFVARDGHWVTNPIGNWSHADVWAYIVSRGLPWNTLYDHEWAGQTRETIRNAGWLTTDGARYGRLSWLRRFYPEMFERLAEEFPRVRHLT